MSLLQRHLTLLWAVIIAATIPFTPVTIGTALAIIGAGVGVTWIGSGAWTVRERWTVRLQATVIGLGLTFLTLEQNSAAVAAVAVAVGVFFLAFIHIGHTIGMALWRLADQVTTTRALMRVEAARQTLYAGTFIVPFALVCAPNIIGVLFVAGSCLLVTYLTRARVRRLIAAHTPEAL